jgi:hypothetical protein
MSTPPPPPSPTSVVATPESLKSPIYTPAEVMQHIQRLMAYRCANPEADQDIELSYLGGSDRSNGAYQDRFDGSSATESEDSDEDDGSEYDDETTLDGDEIFFDAVTDQEPLDEDAFTDAPAEINADESVETAGGNSEEESSRVEMLWDNY